jgi:hypothetical protein
MGNSTSRRQFLAAPLIASWAAGLLSPALRAAAFDVDRLLESSAAPPAAARCRRYTASATVMLLSIPIVSKSGVGSGYALIEEAGRTTSIQFGAGSNPPPERSRNARGGRS